MAGKVLVNLTTGMEDPEQVTLAFLVATAALEQGHEVVLWTTKEAVRLGLPGTAQGEACDGCPPLERLFQQFAGVGRPALAVPDLRQRARVAGRGDGRARDDRRRHADVAVGRRRHDGLQLLTKSDSRRC